MTFLTILKIAAALATVATGLLALIKPTAVYGFTGLTAPAARGITEIRSIFGGLFITLGLVPLFLGDVAYQMLGFGYLGIALVRLFSIFFDKSPDKSNWISLATEIVLGIILVI